MSRLSRRALLCGAGGLSVVVAGCLETMGGSGDDMSGTDDDVETGLVDHERLEFQHSMVSTNPDAALLLDAEDAEEWLADRQVDSGSSAAHFAEETSFDESVLVALEADAPTPCHRLRLGTVGLEGDTLVIDAAVRDESAADEECPQQEVTVCTFVRATFADEPTTELTVHITGRDGTEHGIGIGTATDGKAADAADDETDGEGDNGAGD